MDEEVAFDGLPDHRSLERVLVSALVECAPHVKDFVEQARSDLVRLQTGHGWKRALRIWNAALFPKTEDASFVDHLLQNVDTRDACLRKLRQSKVGDVLDALLAPA